MPYIKPIDRIPLDLLIQQLREQLGSPLACPGHFNYAISMLLYPDGTSLTYSYINAVQGILTCVASEFYRRVAVPYEEEKRQENGDIL